MHDGRPEIEKREMQKMRLEWESGEPGGGSEEG